MDSTTEILQPLVSVIIPNYNHALYLEQRIKTVLNQSFQDFELIILDDCSTDSSREILEQYKNHSKIQLYFNEQNSGSVFKQWEKGIQLANGKYIWIAESDDYAENTFLEKLVPIIHSNNEIGLIYSDSYIVIDNSPCYISSKDKNRRFNTTKWAQSYIVNGSEEIKETLVKRCSINNASAVLFNKTALASIFPLPYNYKNSGDYFIYIAIANIYKIAYYAEVLNYFRYHTNNTFKPIGNIFIDEHYEIYSWLHRNSSKFLTQSEIAKSFAETVTYPLLVKKSLIVKSFIHWIFKNPLFIVYVLKQIVFLYYKKFTK